jgi:hypothetical protein
MEKHMKGQEQGEVMDRETLVWSGARVSQHFCVSSVSDARVARKRFK